MGWRVAAPEKISVREVISPDTDLKKTAGLPPNESVPAD